MATTEGYASRPGGAQAELLVEVNKHEAERNLEVVMAEFRNYQQGAEQPDIARRLVLSEHNRAPAHG